MNGIEWRETALVMVVMGLPKCFLNVMTINSVISWSDWVSKTCIYLYFQHFRWAEHNHVGYYLIYIRGRTHLPWARKKKKKMQIFINYKCNVHKSEAYRREQAGMWQGSSARNVGMSVKIYGCCACTVEPNDKNPPKIRSENSWNWRILIFLQQFDEF